MVVLMFIALGITMVLVYSGCSIFFLLLLVYSCNDVYSSHWCFSLLSVAPLFWKGWLKVSGWWAKSNLLDLVNGLDVHSFLTGVRRLGGAMEGWAMGTYSGQTTFTVYGDVPNLNDIYQNKSAKFE